MTSSVTHISPVNRDLLPTNKSNDRVSVQTRSVATETQQGDASLAARPRVLVVEDDDAIARAYARAGEDSGYEVVVTNNGLDAVDLAVSKKPQAILLDIGLPGLDGRDVMKRFNQLGITTDTVVVFISGRDQQNDRLLGLELGAHDYETKPVPASMLFTKVGRLLEKKRVGVI
jgi:DNA-binding response OmpR family regulator